VRYELSGFLIVLLGFFLSPVTAAHAMWSKSINSPFTGTATATGNSSTWIGNVIAFKRN